VVSWSVRARAEIPSRYAFWANSVGVSDPSEKLECVCRSITEISVPNTLHAPGALCENGAVPRQSFTRSVEKA